MIAAYDKLIYFNEASKYTMTVDEAKTVVVQIGTCRGWTLEQVAQRRPASLKWYLYGCDQADNILKAAASVLLDNLQQKAG